MSRDGGTCLPAGRWYTRMYYVYILQSIKNGRFYKGLSTDLEKRLQQHFSGYEKPTKNLLPMKLVHVEICTTRIDARKLEKFFKSGYGREILKEITEN